MITIKTPDCRTGIGNPVLDLECPNRAGGGGEDPNPVVPPGADPSKEFAPSVLSKPTLSLKKSSRLTLSAVFQHSRNPNSKRVVETVIGWTPRHIRSGLVSDSLVFQESQTVDCSVMATSREILLSVLLTDSSLNGYSAIMSESIVLGHSESWIATADIGESHRLKISDFLRSGGINPTAELRDSFVSLVSNVFFITSGFTSSHLFGNSEIGDTFLLVPSFDFGITRFVSLSSWFSNSKTNEVSEPFGFGWSKGLVDRNHWLGTDELRISKELYSH
jgi:hypothetical protein